MLLLLGLCCQDHSTESVQNQLYENIFPQAGFPIDISQVIWFIFLWSCFMEIVPCFVISWNILSFRFSDEMAIFPNRGIWLEKMQTS